MGDTPPPRRSTDELIEDGTEHEAIYHSYKQSRPSPRRPWQDWLMLTMGLWILILCAIIVYQQASMPACRTLYQDTPRHRQSRLDPSIDETHTSPVRFISQYSAKDTAGMAAVDAAWDAIAPTLGTVALDAHFAKSLGLPAGDSLLADPNKNVYVLEAYHSVHCLKVIRQTMLELAKGDKLTVPFGHSTHCLAGVLEHVVCSADDTLLFYKEGVSTGDGQARTCRNWEALRSWAGNHSACYYVDELATQHEDLTRTRCPREDGLVIGNI